MTEQIKRQKRIGGILILFIIYLFINIFIFFSGVSIIGLIMAIYSLVMILKIFKKRKRFIHSVNNYLGLIITFSIISIIVVWLLLGGLAGAEGVLDEEVLGDLVAITILYSIGILIAFIWKIYFKKSKRVKVTFIK
jgi:hypothetical protein